MNRKSNSSSSLFLMEILINILLFSVMLSICLQFSIKAHKLTNTTTELERAVTVCSNVANVFEAGDGSYDSIASVFDQSLFVNNQLVIYYDDSFIECSANESVYVVVISIVSDNSLSKASISCQKDATELYQITACNYIPFFVQDIGGDIHE